MTGQLLVKTLLGILKHRALDKTVDRCELNIIQGCEDDDSEETDQISARLVIKMFCKHGVTKTHRLVLMSISTFMSPDVPKQEDISTLTIGPGAMQGIMSHFPSRGKGDHQLIWQFDGTEVQLRSLESAIDSKGKPQLSTELTLKAGEFETYAMLNYPAVVGWYLKEFNATIAYAEAMSLSLEMRFTDPGDPLFIDADMDDIDTLFVLATFVPQGASATPSTAPNQARQRAREAAAASSDPSNNVRKRARDVQETPRNKRPIKVVQRVDANEYEVGRAASVARSESHVPDSQPAFSTPLPPISSVAPSHRFELHDEDMMPPPPMPTEPLFLPATQLSQAEMDALGLEDGNIDLMAMLEDDGEEIGEVSFTTIEDDNDSILPATQESRPKSEDSKTFKPLFDD